MMVQLLNGRLLLCGICAMLAIGTALALTSALV